MHTVIVSAAILIEERRGEREEPGERGARRVLISQRKAGTHLEGAWEFPGGKVQTGEDPREALRRELHEELGIDAAVGEIVDVTFHRYAEADKAVLLLFFEASRAPGSPEPRAIDVAAVSWAGTDDLDPARFPPADLAVLEKVRARLARGSR